MDRKYRISNDGTIFEIKEDGSIAKLAIIDGDGCIRDLSGTIMTAKTSNKGVFWFFIILFAIAAIIFGALYIEAQDNYYYANWELNEYRSKYENASSATSSLRSEVSSIRQERDNAKSELSSLKSKVSGAYPMIITNIQIANVTYDGDVLTNYGNTIYSSGTMYLKPRIEYTGLASGSKTLKVKLYTPNGTISTGTSSPSGFSYTESMYVNSGDNNTYSLGGWGSSTKGHWRSGTYRIEIWYENTCLKAKTFTIY